LDLRWVGVLRALSIDEPVIAHILGHRRGERSQLRGLAWIAGVEFAERFRDADAG
jgi:hypothetical protein